MALSPAKKVPLSTHHMWEVACQDLESEQCRTKVIRSMPEVTPEAIVDCERRLRLRQAICNALDFLITNEQDINAVIARRNKEK